MKSEIGVRGIKEGADQTEREPSANTERNIKTGKETGTRMSNTNMFKHDLEPEPTRPNAFKHVQAS